MWKSVVGVVVSMRGLCIGTTANERRRKNETALRLSRKFLPADPWSLGSCAASRRNVRASHCAVLDQRRKRFALVHRTRMRRTLVDLRFASERQGYDSGAIAGIESRAFVHHHDSWHP